MPRVSKSSASFKGLQTGCAQVTNIPPPDAYTCNAWFKSCGR
jgi:hypothetical protein